MIIRCKINYKSICLGKGFSTFQKNKYYWRIVCFSTLNKLSFLHRYHLSEENCMSLKNARVISTNVILGSLVGFINPFNKVMQFWEPTEANYMLGHSILGYNILWYDSYTLYVTSLIQATEFIFTDREQKCSILIIVKK